MKETEDKTEAWRQYLATGNEYQMFMASVGLSRKGDTSGVDILLRRMKNAEHSTEFIIIAASLARFRDPRAVEPLIDLLEHAAEFEAREEVRSRKELPILYGDGWRGKIYHACFGRTLRQQNAGYRETARVTYCRSAAMALGALGDKRAIAPLKKCLNDPNASVRQRVAIALAQIEAA